MAGPLFTIAAYPLQDRRSLLFGRDETPGIVCVGADRRGRARVWRRIDGRVTCEEDTYPNWFFLGRRELLGDLPVVDLDPSVLATKPAIPPGAVGLVQLHGDNPLRYLVLTDRPDEVEAHVAQMARQELEDGSPSESLSQLVYVRPAVEQYLTITGRTYFKGMTYRDVRRLQFDLETTGISGGQDRIFMVSVKDSDGLAVTLDVGSMTEAELIQELARIIRERDPDVIENHNIFDFDIKFLITRARALGVRLPLGRDGTEFWESRDSVKIGAGNQGFTRYSLTGREIIDTLHAARRFSAIQRDLRSSGLKEAARYLGVASEDREYIDGANIWPTFQEDPERVRRYCWDDVEEVDRISQVLMAPPFVLASMVPRSYERIATSGTGQGLIEPLLVRAYLAAGRALPLGHDTGSFAGGATGVFTTGVVRHVVKADVASLYPSIMLAERIAPATDQLGIFSSLLEELTTLRLRHKRAALGGQGTGDRGQGTGDGEQVIGRPPTPDPQPPTPAPRADRAYHQAMQAAMKVLINSFYGMLGASFALFCDKTAAERVTARGREILQMLLDELERRGAILVEADTDGVLFSLPPHADGRPWTPDEERALIEEVGRAMPAGIQLEHDGRYQAMYSYMEKNYALLDHAGETPAGFQRRDPIRLVGSAFRSSKAEPFIERFLAQALKLLLEGNIPAVRALYRDTCDDLRARRVPVGDLCVTMPLSKTPQAYAASQRKEEPYEVYLAAGFIEWKQNHRIRYYQTRRGKKLLDPQASDYDADFYIGRLTATCKQRLERAFAPEDLDVLFSESDGLFDPPLETIQPLCERRVPTLVALEEPELGGEDAAEPLS
jgi:DNA polymerase elongation subunit (family B)